MIVTACQCSEGFDLPHSHCRVLTVRRDSDGKEIKMGSFLTQPGWTILKEENYIRIWVDWSEVAKELARDR